MQVLHVSLFSLCLLTSVHGQAGLSQLPGIDAWQAAIQQHVLAEGKVVPKKEGEVPGLANWEQHQRAVIEAEKRLQQNERQGTGEENKEEEKVIRKLSQIRSK